MKAMERWLKWLERRHPSAGTNVMSAYFWQEGKVVGDKQRRKCVTRENVSTGVQCFEDRWRNYENRELYEDPGQRGT